MELRQFGSIHYPAEYAGTEECGKKAESRN